MIHRVGGHLSFTNFALFTLSIRMIVTRLATIGRLAASQAQGVEVPYRRVVKIFLRAALCGVV
jgi:hypothetical protein